MELSFLTWNIWFKPFEMEERTKNIMNICDELNPDFIAFQEVTPVSFNIIKNNLRDYKLSNDFLQQSYDTILLSKYTCVYRQRTSLPDTKMGRNFLRGCYDVGEKEINIGTFHLESVFKEEEKSLKDIQLDLIYHTSPLKCIIMGDTNFLKEEKEHKCLVDLYNHNSNKDECEYTYCGAKNILISDKNKNSRFDRIYIKNYDFEIKDYKLVGIDNSLYYKTKKKNGPPSDHYGVYSNLLLKE